MPTFSTVLFDLDHTLFDFEQSRRSSFSAVLDESGIDDDGSLLDVLHAVEGPLWSGLERGELTLETLNNRRFAGLVETANLDADPNVMADSYLGWLGKTGGLFPGARELLEELAQSCTLALVTNGYARVQRARMSNFDLARYFETVTISDEVGVAKPNPAFLDHTFSALNQPSKSSTILVGDSLSSDMTAATQYGIANCWYNPARKSNDSEISVAFEVSKLAEISAIIIDDN